MYLPPFEHFYDSIVITSSISYKSVAEFFKYKETCYTFEMLGVQNISFFAWPYIFWFINNSSGKWNCCHAWRKRLRWNVHLYPWSMIYCSLVTPFLGSTFFSNLQFITFNAWRVILFKSSILSYNDTFFLKYIIRNSLPLKSGHEVTLKQILHIDKKHMNWPYYELHFHRV